jgi:hypothetical protein
MTGWDTLERVPLQRVPGAVGVEGVDVFLAGMNRMVNASATNPSATVLSGRTPNICGCRKTPLVELGSDSGCADLTKFVQGAVGQRFKFRCTGHVSCLPISVVGHGRSK